MKKLKTTFFCLLLSPVLLFAQKDSVLSGAYAWKEPVVNNNISSAVLLEGRVHDFEWIQLTANVIASKKTIKKVVSAQSEELIIIKAGLVKIQFNDSSYSLTPGSVAVLMPGQEYKINNEGISNAAFYSMKYKSKKQADQNRNNKSFVKVWESISYKPNNNGGGRRDFFEQPTAMQKRFEMHVTTLKEGLKSHEPHTHRAEEIVLLIEGETEMQLGNDIVKTEPGGFYYLGSNVSHAIKNIGTKPATYFAFQFE